MLCPFGRLVINESWEGLELVERTMAVAVGGIRVAVGDGEGVSVGVSVGDGVEVGS